MKSIKDMNNRPDPQSDAESTVESLRDKYSGYSESELMQALMSSVSAAKRDGSFDAAQLEEFAGFVSPSLDDAGRERLRELVDMIKGTR